ncbi:MAG: DUF3488 and transglutaminase-like domain-containing protein [Gracilibacteraceae bacterium]|jgi:transglutaminase-like putative cysteine protease|nr:DUF3488 and transglutaminase-like domain-containing protein [Gracilibacteraceae bacterium]
MARLFARINGFRLPAFYSAALVFSFLQPFRAHVSLWGAFLVWGGALLLCAEIFSLLRRLENCEWPGFLSRFFVRLQVGRTNISEQARVGWLYYRLILLAVFLLFHLCYPSFSQKHDWAVAVKTGSLSALNGSSTPVFLIFLFVLACFVFSSLVYYFTHVRLRLPALFLIALIPCLLASSQMRVLGTGEIFLLAASFIAAAWAARLRDFAARGRTLRPPWPPLVLTLTAAGLLVAFMPALPPTPYDFFRLLYSYGLTDAGDSADTSGPRLAVPDNRLLLEAEAAGPLYLRQRVFSAFDGASWSPPAPGGRIQSSPFSPGASAEWEENQARLTGQSLYAILQSAAALDPRFAARQAPILSGAAPSPQSFSARIRHMNFITRTVLLPGRTFQLDGLAQYYRATIRDALGVTWLPGAAPLFAEEEYSASYFSDEADLWLAERLGAYTAADYAEMLEETDRILAGEGENPPDAEARETLALFRAEAETAELFQTAAVAASYDAPASLHTLAAEITAGLRGDLAKAQALENYFHANGYKYDLNYNPPQGHGDVAAFVLENKRGVCADYATAMTLMARAAGLQARYTEGFYAGEADADGIRRVRAENAHAWTEVFIPGSGWTVFEPTPGYALPPAPPFSLPAGRARGLLLAALAGAVLGGPARRLIARPAEEIAFRLRLRHCPREQGLFRLYARALALAEQTLARPAGGATAREFAALVSQACHEDVSPLTRLYEKTAFAGAAVTKKEFSGAYRAYRLFCGRCRRRGKDISAARTGPGNSQGVHAPRRP